MPSSWSTDMIWWYVYPLGFTGAERFLADAGPDPVPRLAQLEDWLDYAVTLGANGLLLGPIFRSATHGYDTLDHFAIDPRLGTADTFTHFVAACRSNGIPAPPARRLHPLPPPRHAVLTPAPGTTHAPGPQAG